MQEKSIDATLLLIPPQSDEVLTLKDTKEVMQRSATMHSSKQQPCTHGKSGLPIQGVTKTAQLSAEICKMHTCIPTQKIDG